MKVFDTQVGGAIANTNPISTAGSSLPDRTPEDAEVRAEVPSPSENQADLDEAETVASELNPIDSSEPQAESPDALLNGAMKWGGKPRLSTPFHSSIQQREMLNLG